MVAAAGRGSWPCSDGPALPWPPQGPAGGPLTAAVTIDPPEADRFPVSRAEPPHRSGPRPTTATPSASRTTAGDSPLRSDSRTVLCVTRSPTAPGEDCVHTGRITRSGQSIVCLPARRWSSSSPGGTSDGLDVVFGIGGGA